MEHERQPDTWPLVRGETLSNHDWFPFFGHRFLGSRFAALCVMEGRRAEGFTAVMLWAEAMRQDPAGTLPDDDLELAQLARIPSIEEWRAMREFVLHGWVPVLVEDHEAGETITRLGHPAVIEAVVSDMHKRQRGRKAGREAAQLALKKSRVRKKLAEMRVPEHISKSDEVVAELARFLDQNDLYITIDNVRVAMVEAIGYTGQIHAFPGGANK